MHRRRSALAVMLVGVVGVVALFIATRSETPEFVVDGRLISYGEAPSEFGRLWVPSRSDVKLPVVVLVHGGFWRVTFDSLVMEPTALDLARRGYAVWNIEYGRTGEGQGGWPHTFEHVGDAIDHLGVLAPEYGLDPGRVAVVGHSAGGHLALWAGGRNSLPDDGPGSQPLVSPQVVIGLAPVVDLATAAQDGLGRSAVVELLEGEAEARPDRYAIATPRNGSAHAVVVLGTEDDIVPSAYSMLPGFSSEVLTIDGADHFDLIDPVDPSWSVVVDQLQSSIGRP